jgi:anti-sigma B factor antagonist
MLLTVTQHDGYVLAKTEGPLDEHARPFFRERLHPLVGKAGTRLVLDLSGSPRINSAGVGNLVALVADANTQGSRVALCNLTPFVTGVMSVTKLDTFFTIAPSVEAAVAKLGSG